MLVLFRIAWWPSAGKELSSWLSALVVLISCRLNCVCVRFPLGVWGRMWNSIASVPDLCFFIYFVNWAASWQNQQSECAPSEDSDQPGHPPSLIRVFAVRMKKAWVLSYPLSAQRRLWSDWADAQPDLSLRWAHSHFVGFVMRRLNCYKPLSNWNMS